MGSGRRARPASHTRASPVTFTHAAPRLPPSARRPGVARAEAAGRGGVHQGQDVQALLRRRRAGCAADDCGRSTVTPRAFSTLGQTRRRRASLAHASAGDGRQRPHQHTPPTAPPCTHRRRRGRLRAPARSRLSACCCCDDAAPLHHMNNPHHYHLHSHPKPHTTQPYKHGAHSRHGRPLPGTALPSRAVTVARAACGSCVAPAASSGSPAGGPARLRATPATRGRVRRGPSTTGPT